MSTAKSEKFYTQQWVSADVAKELQKSASINPEFDVNIQELEWHEDNDMVKLRLTFRNCGKNVFTQRLMSFLIKSLYKSK